MSCVYPGRIPTAMFSSMRPSTTPFLTPNVTPQALATEIRRVLNENRGENIHLPWYSNLMPLQRLMPWQLADWIARVNGSMSDFFKSEF